MNALQHCLDRLQAVSLGHVVHVGSADKTLLGWVLSHPASQVAVAPGDADWSSGFWLPAERSATLQVCDRPVLAEKGEVEWCSYTLPEANGPLDPAGLRNLYPRLHLQERSRVRVLALKEWLASLEVAVDPATANLLVLDCPGHEMQMIESLPEALLRAFDWVLLRSARPGLLEGACTPEGARAAMHQRFYVQVPIPAQDLELWQLSLFSFSASAATIHALTTERDQQASLAHSNHLLREQLSRRNEELEALNSELSKQVAALTQTSAEAEAKTAEHSAALAQAIRSRDEQQKYANERYKKIALMDAELAELQARNALLREELAKAEAHVELIAELLIKEPAP